MWKVQSSKEPIRLFESDFLEFFSHVHPAVVLIIWIPVELWFVVYGLMNRPDGVSLLYFPICMIIGLMLWSLTEYGLHRFVFHWD